MKRKVFRSIFFLALSLCMFISVPEASANNEKSARIDDDDIIEVIIQEDYEWVDVYDGDDLVGRVRFLPYESGQRHSPVSARGAMGGTIDWTLAPDEMYVDTPSISGTNFSVYMNYTASPAVNHRPLLSFDNGTIFAFIKTSLPFAGVVGTYECEITYSRSASFGIINDAAFRSSTFSGYYNATSS